MIAAPFTMLTSRARKNAQAAGIGVWWFQGERAIAFCVFVVVGIPEAMNASVRAARSQERVRDGAIEANQLFFRMKFNIEKM